MSDGIAGFSADTEVLTRGGWIPVTRVTCLDEVATRSPAGRFEWQHPENVTTEHHGGDLVHLRSRNTDLLVAPQTRVLVMERQTIMRNRRKIELPYRERSVSAGAVIGKKYPLVATSTWEPPSPPEAVELTAPRSDGLYDKRFSAAVSDFAAFMGMYLAEGTAGAPGRHAHPVSIWQTEVGNGFAAYQVLLDRMLGRHLPWNAGGKFWRITNKALWAYVRECGQYAWTKQIPADILDLPPAELETFWHYYWLGDGTTMVSPGRKPVEVMQTTSPVMAGQLQEILQKLGGWAMIQVIDASKYNNRPYKLHIKTVHMIYRMVRRAGTVAFASTIERVPYGGTVTLLSADGRAVYVRRNFRPVWAGGGLSALW